MDTLTPKRLKLAVFIDFDNIEIGVKTTLNQPFDIGAILEAVKERGEVVTKVAYGDWKRAGDYGRLLSQHAIRMVQRNLTPGGDKNGADINLALDALEMAFTHDHINAFVIVGGDSDFITLVEKLKQYDKTVFVVGGRQFTSQVMQKNCHEFIAYENLVGGRRPATSGRRSEANPSAPADVAKAIPLVKRALKILSDREVSPQLGLLKSTLLQLDSTFSERDYGVSTFRDFIEKVARTGLVTLRHAGRSMLVDLVEAQSGGSVESAPAPEPAPTETREAAPVTPDPAQTQQMIDRVRELFQRFSSQTRWPMYVRQVKQHLRAIDDTFNERTWGFATIVELLRACQREGLVRLERDRRGVLRVFPGASLPGSAVAPDPSTSAQMDDLQIPRSSIDPAEADSVDLEPAGETEPAPHEKFNSSDADAVMPGETPARTSRARRSRKTAAAAKPATRSRAARRRTPAILKSA